jgi:DNA-directed RNA polymerase specialized sigma24 family protein
MTGAGLTRLLAILDSDEARAAEAYEQLRRTVQKYFEWQGARSPDECVDVVLDRLVEKLEQGTPIADLRAYARGIARFVLLEERRQPVTVTLDAAPEAADEPSQWDEDAPLQRCFDRCLGELPVDSRRLALEFYADADGGRIDHRHRLARRLNVSDTGLRSRVRRVRERLERCVDGCLDRNR